MEFRTLGSTGVTVSRFALGAMSFGALGNSDHDHCARIINRALDAGINVVDTADFYSNGESEVIVGDAIRTRRDDLVLASKCYWPMGADPNRRGLSRRWIKTACEESLRRLGTDRLDIYYLHKPDPDTDLDESLGALSDLVHEGKVHAAGISTFPPDLIVEAHWIAVRRGHVRPLVEQPPYSILNRHIEVDVLSTCQRLGMGVMTWGPLNGGYLTGKYAGAERPVSARRERIRGYARKFDERRPPVGAKRDAVNALIALAAEAGMPLAHLSLAWTVEHPAVTSAIIGPRTEQQLEDLLGAADLRLDEGVLDAIDNIVEPGIDVDPIEDAGWTRPWLVNPVMRRRQT